MSFETHDARARTKEIRSEYAKRGDALGWFEALYREAAGDNDKIPWADLEPNRFFRAWAEKTNLQGNGHCALVVGCGLGDDARFLDDLGFKVTAFDISETAIEWAKKIHAGTNIDFHVADLLKPPHEWLGHFEFVLEIYTIQPLPLDLRPQVIDAIAGFVAPGGSLIVVTRGRENDEIPPEMPWALSHQDLAQFEAENLRRLHFEEMPGDEEPPIRRFVVEYEREK